MKRIGILFSILVLIVMGLFVALDTEVSEKYETYAIAKEKGLFSRGWLPDIIPLSSTNISDTHDLDLNISEGEFSFSPHDAQIFISKLKPYSRSQGQSKTEREMKLEANGYLPYEYTNELSRWVFWIQSDRGHAVY